MNHTQGKWVANDVHYLSVDRLIKPEGEIITNEIRSDKNGEFIAVAPREANARLIASAPEMLEALQEICGDAWALDEIHPNELTRDRLYKMLKDIGMFTEKLIAKVEGK